MIEQDATPHHTRLEEFLLDLFSPGELRRFVHERYPRLEIDLREEISPREYVACFTALLRRHGELDQDFFAALQEERPKRVTEIAALATPGSSTTSPSEFRRGPSLALSWTATREHPDAVSNGVLRLPPPRICGISDVPTDGAALNHFADEQAFHRWYCAEFWPLTLRWASLSVRNDGTGPATHIDILIKIPPTLCLMQDLSQIRAHLHPAKRLVLALRDLVTPTEQALLRREQESLLKPKHGKTIPRRLRVRILPDGRMRITAWRLMHTYALPSGGPFAVIALPGAPTGQTTLACEVFCHEYRQRMQTNLTVLIEETNLRAESMGLPEDLA